MAFSLFQSPGRAALLLAAAVASVSSATAQEPPRLGSPDTACQYGRISSLFIDNHSIFNTAEMGPEVPFQWAYRAANRLHIRTRQSFIEDELLFRVGDCLDPLRIAESERILRNYEFISLVDIYAVEQPDGSQHVIVDTQDEWTTKLDLQFEIDEGVRLRRAGVTEANFLGTGNLVGFFFKERDEAREMGLALNSPRLGGTRLDGTLRVGQTRTGQFFEESVFYPFVGELGRFAMVESFSRRQDRFSYTTPRDSDFTNVVLPIETRRGELTFAFRTGDPGNLTIFGFGLAREERILDRFPDGVLAIFNGDFSMGIPADSSTLATVTPQADSRETTRANILFGRRSVRFVTRRGLDALRGEQDIRIGTLFLATLGRNLGRSQPNSLGVEQDEFWARLSTFGGKATESLVLNVEGNIEATRTFRTGQVPTPFGDILGEIDAYLYWRRPASNHTVVARISGAGGWNVTRPFQLTLGGRDGIRGYSREDFPGGRRFIFSLEDRILLGSPMPNLFDLGLTMFVDGGAMWAGDVPFGADSGFKSSVGVGLRLGLPSGTQGVVRIDVVSPIGRDWGELQLRITMTELISLARGVEDFQMRRSRDIGPSSDIFGIQRIR